MSRKVISGIAIVLVMMASLASCVVQKECREPVPLPTWNGGSFTPIRIFRI